MGSEPAQGSSGARPASSADPGELKPSIMIRVLHNMIGRFWNLTLQGDPNVSSQNKSIIAYLDTQRDHDVFQYDIERKFSITRSTASRVLSLMEKKGLITRESVERDARVRKIMLTAQGEQIAHDLRSDAALLESTLMQGFSERERLELMRNLERMKLNLLRFKDDIACEGPPDARGSRTRDDAGNVNETPEDMKGDATT